MTSFDADAMISSCRSSSPSEPLHSHIYTLVRVVTGRPPPFGSRNFLLSFCSATLCKRGLWSHAVSVCLSVRLSRSWILSIRVIVTSDFLHHRTVKPFSFFTPNVMATFWWGPPNGGVQCRWGRHKSGLSTNSCRLSIDEQQLWQYTVQFIAQTATHDQWFLFTTTSMDDHDEEKRTEENLFVRSGKSEAEVTNNRCLRSTHCTIEANYWQTHYEASRGLSATAWLFVYATLVTYQIQVWGLQVGLSRLLQILMKP